MDFYPFTRFLVTPLLVTRYCVTLFSNTQCYANVAFTVIATDSKSSAISVFALAQNCANVVFATHLLANLCPLKITIESVNIAVLSMMHVVPPLRPSVALGVDASDPRRIVWTLEKASLTRCSATDIRTVLDT